MGYKLNASICQVKFNTICRYLNPLANVKFVDQESGKVIYEMDLQTSSTGSNDTVVYAMDRNGEALAKVITKSKGK